MSGAHSGAVQRVGIRVGSQKSQKKASPPNKLLRLAADTAEGFYRRWCALNRQHGVKDHGVRQKMKYEAAELACKLEKHDVDPEGVIAFLRRPNSRRNP